jgi:hypothetical protein
VAARRNLSPEERAEILDQHLIAMTGTNGRVETHSAASAVVVNGKPVNHVLHLLLSLFCCGWWVPVWLALVALGGERRTTVSVDQYGRIGHQRAPMEPHRIIIMVMAAIWAVLLLVLFTSCAAAIGGHHNSSSTQSSTRSVP